MDMDDAKVFKILDLEDIEKTFSAYQRQQVQALCCSWLIPELMRHDIFQPFSVFIYNLDRFLQVYLKNA